MEKKAVGKLFVDGVQIREEVTIEYELEFYTRPVAADVKHIPIENLIVKVEIKSFCFPLSWLPCDLQHTQN